MKVAWILLLSLFLVYVFMEDAEAWRRRRFRVRVRVRRIVPRIRRVVPRIRRVVPRVRVRRFARRLGRIVKKVIKTTTKAYLLANPHLFVAKKVFDKVKQMLKKGGDGKNGGCESQEKCNGGPICGGECYSGSCGWHCDDACNVFRNDKINWPSKDIKPVPCKYEDYDLDGWGYFEPAELAPVMGVRARDRGNKKVFDLLDQNKDGRVTKTEFNNRKSVLLFDPDEKCN